MMSVRAFALALLAACELQPAPKKQAAPPPPPPAEQVEAAKPVEAPPGPIAAGSGSAAKIEVTAPCMEVATKLAQLFIDVQTDPGAKSNAEQARGDMTRKMGEACTVQVWSADARSCFLAAKSEPDIRACEKKFPPPRPAAPPQQPMPPSAPPPGPPSAPPPGPPTAPTKPV
jgi:hypothetical protein